MARMTKRERIMRTMAFQETDRVPLYDIFQNDAIIEHYSGRKFAPGNGAEITGLAVGRVLDMTRMAGGPVERPQTTETGDGWIHRSERWTGWIVQRPFNDVDGFAEWVKHDIVRARATRYDRAHREAFHAYLRGREACFAQGDPDGDPTLQIVESLPGLTHMYHQGGQELFCYLMLEQPGLVEEWFEELTLAQIRRVRCIADPDLIPLALTADDIAYKNGPLFSPRWLREHFMPRLKRLNDTWHELGAKCIFHSDGNLWSVMDDLVATGIDGLNPLEVLADMTPAKVREQYPQLVLTGGIDVSQLLTFGTPEEVRRTCLQAIEDTGGVGYLMGSSTELHWDVTLANGVAMFEAAWGGMEPGRQA